MNQKKIASILLALLLCVSILAGCNSGSSSSPSTTSPASTPDTEEVSNDTEEEEKVYDISHIAVTYVKSPLNVPSIVEREEGIFANAFAPYGLDVEYSTLTTGPEQTQALASGDIQFLYAVGATSVILSASNGADIKIVSMYSRSPEAFRLFTNDDSITSAADLAGKKVAGPKGTILHELLVAYLGTAGLTEDDIEFYAMDLPSSQAALMSGEVDCALLAGPNAYNTEKDGYRIVTTGEGLVDATIVTATSGKFWEDHPELVQAFVDAQKEVLAYMDGNHEEILQMTADETELAIEAVEEMYPMYDFDITIRDSDIAAIEQTEQFMRDNDMTENEVDIRDLLLDIA